MLERQNIITPHDHPPDLDLTFDSAPGVHERSKFGDAFSYLIDQGVIQLSPHMADVGCGRGCLGLQLATSNQVENVLLTDVNPEALRIAQHNAEVNGLSAKCRFRGTNTWEEVERTVLANLPQDRMIEACGKDGSAIQRLVIEEVARQSLRALYVKDMADTESTVDKMFVTDRFEVDLIGRAYGSRRRDPGEIVMANYFRLTPKNR